MPEKWQMMVAATDRWHSSSFQIIFVSEKQVRVCFSFQSKEYWSKIKVDKKQTIEHKKSIMDFREAHFQPSGNPLQNVSQTAE